jgi:hypothetical protein
MINEQNEAHDAIMPREIKSLEWQWQDGERRSLMVADMLDRRGPTILRDGRERGNGVVTKMCLMDRYGLNVAMSDPTSNFWQGDEAEFQDTFGKGPGAVHVSEVKFDGQHRQSADAGEHNRHRHRHRRSAP